MLKELKESQDRNRVWVHYGRVISEILHQGGILKAITEVQIYNDTHLGTVTGKVIKRTLGNMSLIPKDSFKELPIDLRESDDVSNLMEDFPPICKKEPMDVQMYHIQEHYALNGKKIILEDVPETMYGGTLSVAKGRKSRRKGMTKEEYLEAEQPSKKAKKGKAASDKLKIGGSGLPSIAEEVQDLDTNVVLNKKTISGKTAASSTQGAPDQPQVPKKKRKPAMRKIKESPYVTQEVEDEEAATGLVTREIRKKQVVDAATLAKIGELARGI
jgi:hypothetical protein